MEGEAGAPLQTKIISIEEVLKDIEEWWNPMLAEYQALVHEKQAVVPVSAKELARREAAGEAFQVIPAKLIFTLKAFTARRKVRCVGCGNYFGGRHVLSQSTLRRRVGRCLSPLLPRSNGVPAVVGRRS